MRNISLLGSTGSIGSQTLDVIRNHPDRFRLVAVSVGHNIDFLRKILHEFQPELVSVANKEDRDRLEREFSGNIRFTWGEEGLVEVATYPKADILVNAILGSIGLLPTLSAIKAGKTIGLANKETLVTGGHLVMEAAKRYGVTLLPIDSEHSAIFQCLNGERKDHIRKLIITASGGSFRDKSREELKNVTLLDALKHPNWSMGAKITIDSATMMNKGLEVIEAHWLFDIPYEKIECVLHRESIVHSMVEFNDFSIIAQMGTPDMRIPIQYALSYPKRLEMMGEPLSLSKIGTLHFQEMDFERFRCLKMAYEAGKKGGTYPTVLNAANEIAVSAFMDGKISFLAIEDWIERALNEHEFVPNPDLETILFVDRMTREKVSRYT